MSKLINRLDSTQAGFQQDLATLLAFEASQDDAIEQAVADILKRVKREGDAAVLEFSQRFDHVQAQQMSDLELSLDECQQALASLPAA